MPIESQINKQIIDKIIKEENPIIKTKLIALYDLLIQIYQDDDEYNKIYREENFDYNNKIQSLFKESLQVIQNEKQIKLKDLKNPNKFFNKNEQEMLEYVQNQQQQKIGWLDLLLKIPFFNQLISEKDKKVLKSLKNIQVKNYQNKDAYQIEFLFDQNDYFENEKLTVDIEIDEDEDYEEGIIEFKGDMIEWKQGMNYLAECKQGQEIRKETSFFWFFKSFKACDFEDDQSEDVIEYDIGLLSDRDLFQTSIDIFKILKEDLMIYLIPQFYDVKIQQFEEDPDDYTEFDSEDNQFKKNKFQKY